MPDAFKDPECARTCKSDDFLHDFKTFRRSQAEFRWFDDVAAISINTHGSGTEELSVGNNERRWISYEKWKISTSFARELKVNEICNGSFKRMSLVSIEYAAGKENTYFCRHVSWSWNKFHWNVYSFWNYFIHTHIIKLNQSQLFFI